MLSNKEIATVANKLQVPLIISDIMAGEGELTDDVHYGLHAVISDLQPDSALLCIALAGLKIANTYHRASPAVAVLKLQCESLVDEYASLWLQNAKEENIDEHQALDALSRVSEDLEGIADLLDLAMVFLQSKDETSTALIKILSIQARAQAVIADEFFGAIYTQARYEDADEIELEDAIAGSFMTDNVIQFPVRRVS